MRGSAAEPRRRADTRYRPMPASRAPKRRRHQARNRPPRARLKTRNRTPAGSSCARSTPRHAGPSAPSSAPRRTRRTATTSTSTWPSGATAASASRQRTVLGRIPALHAFCHEPTRAREERLGTTATNATGSQGRRRRQPHRPRSAVGRPPCALRARRHLLDRRRQLGRPGANAGAQPVAPQGRAGDPRSRNRAASASRKYSSASIATPVSLPGKARQRARP